MTKTDADSRAVILLGHGSRAAGAADRLAAVADRLAERLGCPVAPASLQFNQPTLEDSCRLFAEAGTRFIVVAPYFLFEGNHIKFDIPAEMTRIAAALPKTRLLLTRPLGSDERLVEVIQARVWEAIGPEPSGPALITHPIESQSFDIIDEILKPADPESPRYQVARRVVHATGDPAMAQLLLFSEGALDAGIAALGAANAVDTKQAPGANSDAGTRIICDVRMVAAGIEPTAARLGIKVSCAVDGPDTVTLAQREGITRGAAGIRRAAQTIDGASGSGLDGAVTVIGNAPTALFECLRLAREEGARPALVVGVPVGFVGAAESKEALAASDLEYITIPGNRGGSNVAAAIANALMRLSAGEQK